ncbi:CCA tRNA nucleotidyltransferase [Paragemmobacter straminiformis]|uniref:CCA tRNA nucleotidyltransferase n=1 Tax=Paragemmobacter straminiformis TaxID=2045119 RepID=A0A842IAD2_9RHOB|nr:CCA tRNA nucleotidyltransferase [Gemmobacter straminiformis]MBC2836064.1 CCA tRNA nucleotidyltransferase [Gemmobacter straminiformis]
MRVAGPWIGDADAQAVCAAIVAGGFKALFVGGCVRNALLGAAVADYDIATDATPETVTNLAEKAGLKAVPTGIDHGTVTVVSGGKPHEVTTFRRDVETDGRRAVVAFSPDVAEDAARRDFTMNALYATAEGELIDPLGGLADLQARRVRFVGDAGQRIAEDYLRILRFFRFHAWYGDVAGGIDPEGLAACAALSAGIETLSRERIGAEMRKLLAAPDPAPAVASMARAGVLAAVLAGADDRALAPLVHLEAGRAPRWQARLAVLGLQDWSKALRLSRAEARDMAALREAVGSLHRPAALGYLLGADLGADAVLVRAALMEQPLPDGWQAEVARGAASVLPVTAADLMPALSGPALGARLKQIEQRWLAADLRASRAELLG